MAVTAGAGGPSAVEVAQAYDRTGTAWTAGPARVYDRLAGVLVAASPVPFGGRAVLDVGAGTGAASRAIAAAGGYPVAVDASLRMLLADPHGRARGLRATVADATALPIAGGRLGGAVAAFCFNHLREPARGFAEATRVCRPGSPLVAAAYADDDDHPAKAAVEQAASEGGWSPEPWYTALRAGPARQLGTVDGMARAAAEGGAPGEARTLIVDLPDLTVPEIVAWRLGLAQYAPFVAALDAAARRRLATRAERLLIGAPPLSRSIIVFAGTVCGPARGPT